MALPKLGANYFQGRAGVHRVGSLLSAARLIFRETDHGDVGIDGYAELTDDAGQVTGATIALQIKSGPSYFHDGGAVWRYYPEEKHRAYWDAFPLPVVLLLHDPQDDRVYWADVRLQLRSDQSKDTFLSVPKANVFSATARGDLFESCGTAGRGLLGIEEVLKTLTVTVNPSAAFPLSHLDIFLEGLTDVERKVFFSVGMCWELAENRLALDAPSGVGMGGTEQEFLDRYLRFLVEQSLAIVDYTDFLIDIRDREMFPTILVPLTSRGRAVRDLCRKLGSTGAPYEITEATVGLVGGPHLVPRSEANRAVSEKMKAHFSQQAAPELE
ncbi:MAG: DUF4365 domain-containing protein [Thermoplasmatota archaeon]